MAMFTRVPVLVMGGTSTVILGDALYEALVLADAARVAHWNVRGPEFVALHGLFGDVYAVAAEAADTIAERIVALGGAAKGIGECDDDGMMKSPPAGESPNGAKLSDQIAIKLAALSRCLLKAFEKLTAERDHGSANIVIGIQNDIDKLIWKVQKFNP